MHRTRRHRKLRRPAAAPLVAIAGAALLGSASAVAVATENGVSREVTVRYGDLDLSRSEGARTLLDRIEMAAERACGTVSIREGVRRYNDARRCIDAAVEAAVRRVRNQRVERLPDS